MSPARPPEGAHSLSEGQGRRAVAALDEAARAGARLVVPDEWIPDLFQLKVDRRPQLPVSEA